MAQINGFLDQFPPDILENILLSMSFTTLAICKTVSRSLNDFISSPKFVDAHLKQSKISFSASSQPYFLGVNTLSEYFPYRCSKIRLSDRIFHTSIVIPMPGGPFLLCYCDGMFLLQGDEDTKFHLWNPTTQKHTTFVYPYEAKGVYGLFRGPMESGEFYIVIGNGSCYGVYSSRSRSWRKVNFPLSGDLRNTAGLYVGGAVYWDWVAKVENRDVQCIVSFDSRDGGLKILERPRVLKDTDRICLVCRNDELCGWFNNVEKSRVRIWRLNDGGCWKELMMIGGVPMGFGSMRPLYFVEDRILIHVERVRFAFYSFTRRRFEEFWDTRSLTTRTSVTEFFPYVDSLVHFAML